MLMNVYMMYDMYILKSIKYSVLPYVVSHDLAILIKQYQQITETAGLYQRDIASLESRLKITQQQLLTLQGRFQEVKEDSYQQDIRHVALKKEVIVAKRAADESSKNTTHIMQLEEMRMKLLAEEKKTMKLNDQLVSANKLYYGMMQQCQKVTAQKDALYLEIDRLKKENTALTAVQSEVLRPYTPRPEWANIYQTYPSHLTASLQTAVTEPSSQQIHSLMKELVNKHEQMSQHQQQVQQTLELQKQTKEALLTTRQELEHAIGFKASSGFEFKDGNEIFIKPKSTSRYFLALGIHKEIPTFLRTNGRVVHHHLNKKDCELVVRDVWASKMTSDRLSGRLDMNMSDFFYLFLKERYTMPSLIAEWGYNMLDALERFRWDADCELFLKVLTGEVPEEAYYDQMNMSFHLTQLFVNLEIIRQDRKSLTLPLSFLTSALRLFFPSKSEDMFQNIVDALTNTFHINPKSTKDYSILFDETSNLSETEFIEEIRDQHLFEIENFMITFSDKISHLSSNDPHGLVCASHIESIWHRLDHMCPIEIIRKQIARGMKLNNWIQQQQEALNEEQQQHGENKNQQQKININSVLDFDPNAKIKGTEFLRNIFASGLVKPSYNYDPAASSKIFTLSIHSIKDDSNSNQKPKLNKKPSLAPESSATIGDLKMLPLARQRGNNMASTLIPPVVPATTVSGILSEQAIGVDIQGHPIPPMTKEQAKLVSAKIMAVRNKFGLQSSSVGELAILERGYIHRARNTKLPGTTSPTRTIRTLQDTNTDNNNEKPTTTATKTTKETPREKMSTNEKKTKSTNYPSNTTPKSTTPQSKTKKSTIVPPSSQTSHHLNKSSSSSTLQVAPNSARSRSNSPSRPSSRSRDRSPSPLPSLSRPSSIPHPSPSTPTVMTFKNSKHSQRNEYECVDDGRMEKKVEQEGDGDGDGEDGEEEQADIENG